ncbi:chromosome segregation protein SMC [Cyanosarcina cf. burmensis CCALA 770]|nr:chromosome segregation protein SMC [Cyanosarcina cf. burmensis CCALA 770]
MLKSLKIENFRCFQSFELQQLGRVNLLVGTNNSGKTSILEAIQLFCSRTSLEPLPELMINRGEYLWNDEQRVRSRELDIRHLFYGHEIKVGSGFSIFGVDNIIEELSISLEEIAQLSLFEENLQELVLTAKWLGQQKEDTKIPLSASEGIAVDFVRRLRKDTKNLGLKAQFVASSSIATEKMIDLFNQLVLTPEEELLIQALQTIEPRIERIASVNFEKYRYLDTRSGFVVRLSDSNQRIPIGSMGDGMWRILGLTLAIVNAKDGVLLVDEIDTGLHFSVMSDMWKLIWETAKRLNVQVFATTHSSDCWTSLATIANAEQPSEDGITMQRIERGKPTSVVFTERQIAIAAERGIEVR